MLAPIRRSLAQRRMDAPEHIGRGAHPGVDEHLLGVLHHALQPFPIPATLQGCPDRARTTSREALALARKLSHPFSLAYALGLAAATSQLCREVDQTYALAEAAGALSSEHGIAFFLAWSSILKGWALAAQGRTEEGIAEQRRGLTAFRGTGAALSIPYFLALIADAHRRAGQISEGLDALKEAESLVNAAQERWVEGEVHRLRGELLLAPSRRDIASAERDFRVALEMARSQEAMSLELRAAISLGRLLRSEGRAHEGHTIVADVYTRFTEGFDTADLREAQALLE